MTSEKEGNSRDEPKKNQEEKRSIESLSEMSSDAFTESLKSTSCVEILFNCLKNVEKQIKETFVLIISTQEQQIKDKRQLNDVRDSVQFISDKFKESEEDRAKKNEILGNLQSEVRALKFQNLKSRLTNKNSTLGETVFSYTESREVRGEKTDGIIIEQNLDIDISLLLLLKTIFGCWFS